MANYETDAFELRRMMRQDAHEKAFEIQVLGQRIFERECTKQVEKDERLLNKEFQDKSDTLNINQKIAASAKNNEVRLRRMACRNECLDELRRDALTALQDQMSSDGDLYRQACKSLLVQGMIKLLEENVELLVREEDVDLFSGLISECEEEFTAHMKEQTDRDYETKLTIREDRYLSQEEGADLGGVMLFALDRRIVVPNSLKDRLNLVFEQQLPAIRKALFPK